MSLLATTFCPVDGCACCGLQLLVVVVCMRARLCSHKLACLSLLELLSIDEERGGEREDGMAGAPFSQKIRANIIGPHIAGLCPLILGCLRLLCAASLASRAVSRAFFTCFALFMWCLFFVASVRISEQACVQTASRVPSEQHTSVAMPSRADWCPGDQIPLPLGLGSFDVVNADHVKLSHVARRKMSKKTITCGLSALRNTLTVHL